MTAAGRHLGGKVATWSIWNEPNLPRFLRPQFANGGRPASPELYRKLYDAGRRGLIAAGRGADPTLFGELAPRGTGSVVAPLTFLRGMLCLDKHYKKRGKGCGRLDTTGMAHHAYTTRGGPCRCPVQPAAALAALACSACRGRSIPRRNVSGATTLQSPRAAAEEGRRAAPRRDEPAAAGVVELAVELRATRGHD